MNDFLSSPWLVVAGGFVLNSYCIGSGFTFGLLMKYLEDDFNVGLFTIGWIGSVRAFLYLTSGKCSSIYRDELARINCKV